MTREAPKQTRMRGADRRALILAQTTKVFAQHGYAEASIGDLARASGITEPMLYKHFGSKRQLFIAVLQSVGTRFIERFRALVAARVAHGVGDALASLVLEYRAAAMAEADNLRVLMHATRSSNDPEVVQLTTVHHEQIYALVYDLLVRAQQQALVPDHLDLVAATWGYLNLFGGVQYRSQMNLIEAIPEAVLQEVNRLWWQSLRTG